MKNKKFYRYNAVKLWKILSNYKKRRNNNPNRLDSWSRSTDEILDYLFMMYRKYWSFLPRDTWFEKCLNNHYIYIDWLRDENDELYLYTAIGKGKPKPKIPFKDIYKK